MATKAELDVFLGMPYAYPQLPVTPGSVANVQILAVAGVPYGYVVVYEPGQIGEPWSHQERLKGRVRVWLYEEGLIGRILLG